MKSGTILFRGTDLGLYGQPRFTLQRTADPAPPARATHWRVVISVVIELRAEMPATVWARARALAALLASGEEGVLEIQDENRTAVLWNATPTANNLPDAIKRGAGRVEMSFTAVELLAAGGQPLSLTVDPLDGSPPLTLTRPASWSQNISYSRPDSRLSHRTEVASTLAFTARTFIADPLADTATRAASLLAEAERLKGMGGREARIQFAGFDEIVQIESIVPEISSGWEFIDVQVQARYVTLPGETTAEASFESSETEDPTTGETRITVSGTIKAEEKSVAEAKCDALLAAWRTPTRRVLKIKKSDDWLDGEDADDAPTWVGLKFEIELSENTGETRYTLRVDTREGADGRRITYSGTAHANSTSVLLATVATAAAGKHPVELRADLGIDFATDDEGTLQLISGTFTHEYLAPATALRASLRLATARGLFGEWITTLSGSVSAPTLAEARTFARSLIPAGVLLRTDEENESSAAFAKETDLSDLASQFTTLEVSYAWRTSHTLTAIKYTDLSAPDYRSMILTRTIAGTAWAPDKATAAAAVQTLLTGLALTNPTAASLTDSHERRIQGATTTTEWLAYEFSYTFETGITGTIGHDIIEAQWSIHRIGQVNHVPITEVPLTFPVKQGEFGYNIGRLTASGTVKARQQSTARTWGQGKRASVAYSGAHAGAEDPPDERITQHLLPFNGTTAAFHEFSFTYAFRYATGLTGTWPSSGLTL